MFIRFFTSVKNAARGLRAIWQSELNFRIQAVAAVLLVIFILIFRFSYSESVSILLAISLVLSAEGFNTAIEKNLDQIEIQPHTAIGRVKDIMAGIVLLTSFLSSVIGILTFWHHFMG